MPHRGGENGTPQPLKVAFSDPSSGERLGPVDTLEALTQDVLNRGREGRDGDPAFNKAVRGEVSSLRTAALRHTSSEHSDPFSMKLVGELMAAMKVSRKSLHLPRGAGRASGLLLRMLT